MYVCMYVCMYVIVRMELVLINEDIIEVLGLHRVSGLDYTVQPLVNKYMSIQ